MKITIISLFIIVIISCDSSSRRLHGFSIALKEFETKNKPTSFEEMMDDFEKCDGIYRTQALALLHISLSKNPDLYYEIRHKNLKNADALFKEAETHSMPAYETIYDDEAPQVNWKLIMK